MMDYAEAAFALVSVGTNVYQHNEKEYGHLNKEKHLPYIPWVGEDFESFEVLRTTAGKKKEVYSVHTVHEIKSIQALEAAAIAMGKVAYFYKYDDFRPLWKIRGIPTKCCGECKKFLNGKADSSILKINIFPTSADRIKQDFQQCHLLVVFTAEGDPFGMVGLLGCAAGVPSLVSKSTGFASFIEEQFPDFNSVVCNIEPADTTERASEKWEEHIMKKLKKYDVARNTEDKLMAKLHEAAKDGIIAEYQTNLLNLVSKLLEDDKIENSKQGHKGTVHTGSSVIPVPPEGEQGEAEESIGLGESTDGNDQNGNGESTTRHTHSTYVGIVEILITLSSCTLAVHHDGTLDEDELRERAKAMLNEITAPEDLPNVQAHLHSLGPITIRLVKKKSLCVVLHCETSESVEKLWVDYRRGKLKSLFTDDIGTAERLQRYRVSAVSLKVSLPRWQYRQAVVRLKYLREGYEPKDASSDLCQICGKMIEAEDDITPYLAVELERSVSESDIRKAELTRILGGDGTYDTPVRTTDKEVSSIMLFKVQTPQQVSALAKERPEILGVLGINRYLNLDTSQLSRVRSEEADGKNCQYDAMELKTMIEESGVTTASEALAQQRDSGFTERLFRILESPATHTYLHTVTLMYDEHKIRQQLKSIERNYNSLQDQYQTMKVNHEEIVKKEEETAVKLGNTITKLKGEKRTLLKTVDEIINPESERRPSVDTNIEEFSFKFDDTQHSYEEILHKLPCHFTWKLEVDFDFRYEFITAFADNLLKHHGDFAPVPNKALKGYLYVSKLRPEHERDSRAALKWFDEALSDNKKELGRCDDNDGPLGDKLVLLADIAWVHFLFGEKEKVRERLKEIANLFVGKLTEKQKSYVYGHKGVAFLYLWKGANDEGIDCLQQALLVFPRKVDCFTMSGVKRALVIGKEWTPRKCPLAVSFVQKEFAIKLARRRHPVYFTALSATDEEKEDAERNGVHLILPNPKLKKKIDEDDMLLLHKETFPHLKNYKPISVIFGHACENGTAEAALAIKMTYLQTLFSFILL
ncbi:uncharacterized protein [Ptychodera flava]|uniref:uncharacterized protein n=1 Tax=Ptychodera flava TaxID=63121 RepID=UPI003969DCEA